MNIFKCLGVVLVMGLMFGAASHKVEAREVKPILTLETANKMADACEALQKSQKIPPLNIAIYDEGANLKLFRRQEGAFLGSIQIAKMKAHTSAVFPFSSRLVGDISYSKDGKPAPVQGLEQIPGIAAFPGGLPILTADKKQIGGIGVSGATADQDEQCAQAGIDAIAEMLK